MEDLNDRHGHCATLVASQLPIDHWHTAIGEPTLADAILDRRVHNVYTITLIRRIDAQTAGEIGRKLAIADRARRSCVAGLRKVAEFARNRRSDSAE